MYTRINKVFSDNKKKLVTFVTGGDPDAISSLQVIEKIIQSGADIIEIGMPFSDPMADGPTIQLSSKRAIENGTNLNGVFNICKSIRKKNDKIPIILMGYYNIIHYYGIEKFTTKCSSIGIDGLIVVDLQPEEDPELYNSLKSKNIDLIRLITPTTTNKRLKLITRHASGFLYYITVTGVTGQKSADIKELKNSIKKIRSFSKLPIIAGFGINTRSQVSEICNITDGAVVGSSIVKIIEENLNKKNKMIKSIGSFISDLKDGIR